MGVLAPLLKSVRQRAARDGIAMRVVGKRAGQRVHPIHGAIRDRMVQPFDFRVNGIEIEPHPFDQKRSKRW
jgi:hypothetical protein